MGRIKFLLIALGVAVVGAAIFFNFNRVLRKSSSHLEKEIAAYLYAYPLVMMRVTQKLMSQEGKYNNCFVHISAFPTPEFKDIVRPNVDTLYSFAWLDLSQGPLILSVPDTNGRYYLMELLDAWTNVFASLGKRTTGTHAQEFLIVGPGWSGELPGGMPRIDAPTHMVLILARTQTNTISDYDVVHAIQEGYALRPADADRDAKNPSVWSQLGVSAAPHHTAPADVVREMDFEAYYAVFSEALVLNPPDPADAPMLSVLRHIGVLGDVHRCAEGIGGDRGTFELIKREALSRMREKEIRTPRVHGWGILLHIGTYGTDYLMRAMITYFGIAANLPEDAVYPTAFVDADGEPLHGDHAYVIHFDADALPPVRAFWSITAYDEQSFLMPNALGRYALGDRDTLMRNEDGSIDMYVQYDSPGKARESNWLPVQRSKFNLTMRLYWPRPEVLEGVWAPPAIQRKH